MENTIDVVATRALLHLAAKDDPRAWMNGVHVEFQENKTVYVATNGHIFGVYTDNDAKNDCVFSLTIPYGIAKQIKINKRGSRLGNLIYDPETNAARLIYYASEQDFGFTPLPSFPYDMSKMIPDSTSGEVAQFNAEYVYVFAQVNKALGAKHPGRIKIEHNGDRGALVRLPNYEQFLGVLMPIRI